MDQVKIGKFIAQLRNQRHLTQEALGEKIGVTNKTISRWENGVYMPDVEMIQLLSNEFGVSINEIIAGERLSEADFKEKAEENIVSAWKNSSFSLKEKMDFFKKKWLKEHVLTIGLCVAVVLAIYIYGFLKHICWLQFVSLLFGLVCYGWFNNRMMIYVEKRVFQNTKEK